MSHGFFISRACACLLSRPAISQTVDFSVTEPLFIEPSVAYISPASDLQLLLETRVVHAHSSAASEMLYAQNANNGGSARTLFDDDVAGSALPASVSVSVLGASSSGATAPNRRVIPMPSSQYKWSVSNATVLSIEKEIGLASGKVLGGAKVRCSLCSC